MKVCMITTMTPASVNIRGTSALPYHLMVKRDKDVEMVIYTVNNNEIHDEKIRSVEWELKTTIHKVSLPKWFLFVFRFRLLHCLCHHYGSYGINIITSGIDKKIYIYNI